MLRTLRLFAAFVALVHAVSLFAGVRGVVLDPRGGALAGARVAAYRWEAPAEQALRMLAGTPRTLLGETASDEHGSFVLDWKVGGVVELEIARKGFAPEHQLVLADDPAVVVELKVAAPRTARVTANGKPVVNALVIAYEEAAIAWTARTGNDGSYVIPNPKGWCTALVVVHPDYAPFSLEKPTRLDVALEPGLTVSGSVTDRGGRPVPKARVMAGLWSATITGEDGAFVLHHVAATEKTVTATAGASFGTARRDAKQTLLTIEPLGTINGTVRDADKRPLEGVPIYAFSSSHSNPAGTAHMAVTDARGNYTIPHCQPAGYSVSAYNAGGLQFGMVETTVRGDRSARADLAATPADVFIGSVVDEKGRPVTGAYVQYTATQVPLLYGYPVAAQLTRTGRDGKFKLGRYQHIPSGGPVMRIQALREGYAIGVSDPLQSDTRTVSIVLPAGIELTGIVTDAAGKPVAGASVALLQDPSGAVPMPIDNIMQMGMMRGIAESDAAGAFSVQLNDAPHDLGVWKEGFAGARIGDVTPNGAGDPLKISLESGVEIRGRVTTKGSTASLAGTIMARSEEGTFATVDVAADGAFSFLGIRPGLYSLAYEGAEGRSLEHHTKAPISDLVLELPLTVELRGVVVDAGTGAVLRSYKVDFEGESVAVDGEDAFTLEVEPATGELQVQAQGYVKGGRQVSVEAGKTNEVTIALTRGRSVSGSVTDEQGAPISGASIWISDLEVFEESDQDGQFLLRGITADALTIAVSADGHLQRSVEVSAGTQDARVQVTLGSGRKVAGHVFTDDGAPVEGAAVLASGVTSQRAVTDRSGAYVLRGLAEGEITVKATHGDRESEKVLVTDAAADVVLVLKPSPRTGRIHGVVKGFSDGKWMYGLVRGSNAQGMIGRDGTYVIERAPAGEIELQAFAQSAQGEATTASVTVTVIPDGDVEANLEFRGDVVVRGIVTITGQPAPGRRVRFRSGSMAWTVVSREGGLYEVVGIEPGFEYEVSVDGGGRSYSTRHHVRGSGTFDIRIEWSTVEGRVLESSGLPVPDAEVEVTTDGLEDSESLKTDAAGMFSFSRARAPHVITIVKSGFATSTQRIGPGAGPLLVTLTRSSGLRVRLTDRRNQATLSGYVVAADASGLPVARTSDAQKDGTMVVPVGPGSYRISVSAGGYASQSMQTTVPREGELQFALTPGGTLILRADRASSDMVKLVLPNGEEYVRCQCNGIAVIRLTGKTTTIENVAPGTYTMQILDPQGGIKSSLPVTIAEGQTTAAEIRVPE